MELSQRISHLSPDQRKLLLKKLEQQNVDVLQFPITLVERNVDRCFPLSSEQERLWFVHQLDPGNCAYNISRAVKLEGKLDKLSLERSLNEIVHRHESLRTQFALEQEKPVQYILPELSVPLEIVDLKNLSGEQREQEVRRIIAAENRRPFNLAVGPLLKTQLLVLNENVHVFLLVIHHIISDGISMQIFIQELVRLYEAFSRDNSTHTMLSSSLPGLPVQYVDYVCWQRQWFGVDAFNDGYGKKLETYWLKQFADDIPLLALPLDYSRPIMQSFEGSQFTFSFDAHETRALKQLELKEKSTLFIVLLAIYTIFLAKLGGMEDIVVGTPVSGRRHPTLQKLIGMFANMLALRNRPNHQKTFTEFLGEVKEQTLSAFENQEYRYEDIVDKLNISRATSRNPLFDVDFLLDSNDLERFEINLPGLNWKSYKIDTKTSKFDLSLIALEEEDRLKITFEYCTKLFKETTIERFMGYFKEILASVVKNQDIKIADIGFVPAEEMRKVLYEFNRTEGEYPGDKTVYGILAEQAEKIPDHIALVFEDSMLSYRELDQRTLRLAMYLQGRGLRAEVSAAVLLKPSLELVIGIIGILKVGGVYLPLNLDFPRERIDYMLKDSGAKLLVTTSDKEVEKVTGWEGEKVFLEEISQSPKSPSYPLTFLPSYLLNSSNLAYIIYTSGSTGNPKAVMVQHGQLMNMLWDLARSYPLEQWDTYLLKTSITFDPSITELFGWFWRGGRLAVLRKNYDKDPEKILDIIQAHQVTHINFVPSMLTVFMEFLNESNLKKLASLKYIFMIGEALLPELVRKFSALGARVKLANVYGPTEITIYAAKYLLDEWDGGERVPVGKPVTNTKLYIVGNTGNIQTIGAVGELCIGGVGVTRGYLNKPELTAEKFAKLTIESNKNIQVYKSGDLVRWMSDGNVDFLGRVDFQIKFRGFRVELGEIENLLLAHKDVKAAVVVARESETRDQFLCAYIVARETGKNSLEIDDGGLRDYLARKLPDYMIPAYFIPLEKMPLNANGKVDRKSLPQPEFKDRKEEYEPPRDEIEKRLVEVWQEVLGRDSVGINDHFFAIGGDSIKAIQVSARLKRYHLNLQVSDLFLYSTIKQLGKQVKIIEQCSDKMEKESSPGDLGYPGISTEQLEEFENDLSDIDQY